MEKKSEKFVLKQENVRILTQYGARNSDDFMATTNPPACLTCSMPQLEIIEGNRRPETEFGSPLAFYRVLSTAA